LACTAHRSIIATHGHPLIRATDHMILPVGWRAPRGDTGR
jgi:hypothetical protein